LRARVAELEHENATLAGTLTEQADELRVFKALIENAPDSVSFADLEGHLMYTNPSFRQSTGYDEAARKMPVFDVLAESSKPQMRHIMEQIMHHGSWEGMLEHQHTNGSTFPAHVSAFLVTDEDGAALGMGAIFRDMSEQVQRSEELHTFQTLVEHAPDGITIVGLDGRLTYANPAFQELLGYGEQTSGMHMTEFRPEHGQTEVPDIMRHLHEHGVWRGRQVYQRRDGTFLAAQVGAFMIYDEQGQVRALMGIHRDITEQERLTQAHEALQQQLIDAQQAAIRELSSPLLPLTDRVVALPLIGGIDSQRAQQVTETLLQGVVQHNAAIVLVDITGVRMVDTQVAQVLVQAASAVKLLGAHMVVTGINPAIAQTIIHLGIPLDGITTYSSLQTGIAAVLR
jgi:rsbT co-antagonist protein RsbR